MEARPVHRRYNKYVATGTYRPGAWRHGIGQESHMSNNETAGEWQRMALAGMYAQMASPAPKSGCRGGWRDGEKAAAAG